jgi:hypothetical protein
MLLKIINIRHTFAWKVEVYIIKLATLQAGFSQEKVYHGQVARASACGSLICRVLRGNQNCSALEFTAAQQV